METNKRIKVLSIFKAVEPKKVSNVVLNNTYPDMLDLIEIENLAEAIEHLESTNENYDLIVFEHNKSTQLLVKTLFSLRPETTYIMFSAEESNFENFSFPNVKCEFIVSTEFADKFYKVLKKFALSARIPDMPVLDKEDYVSINADSILLGVPIQQDIYIRMSSNRHIRLFSKNDVFDKEDLQKYKDKRAVDRFYVKRSDCDQAIQNYAQNLQTLSQKPNIDINEAVSKVAESNKLIREVVSEIGFTAQAQEVAKSSVILAMRVMGNSPKMAAVLTEIKKRDENYIGSHSYALGHVACALAHCVGWDSETTYLKLSMAAFLHDISLTEVAHAEVNDLVEAKKSEQFSPEEIEFIKTHPIRSSEYAQGFAELPPDIDQILAQHHEQPNGSGFPREINGKNISPLSAIFIIAHAIIDYIIENPEGNITSFVKDSGEKYQMGQFKKIITEIVKT